MLSPTYKKFGLCEFRGLTTRRPRYRVLAATGKAPRAVGPPFHRNYLTMNIKRIVAILLAALFCLLPIGVAAPPSPATPTALTPSTPVPVTYDASGRAYVTLQWFLQTNEASPALPFVGWLRGGRPVSSWSVRQPERWGAVTTVTRTYRVSGTPGRSEVLYVHLTDAGQSFPAVLSIQRL